MNLRLRIDMASLWVMAHILGCSLATHSATVDVRNSGELRKAVAEAVPGTYIRLAPGRYAGGLSFSNLQGTLDQPVVIAAADATKPPRFDGGGAGMHLIDPVYVELRGLHFSGLRHNGINIDDGGSYDTPAHHILLDNVTVEDVGPQGNRDGIKLSGVDDFHIQGCLVENWGVGGGSAIDMVGCHRGVIENCVFRHTNPSNNSGIQAKGGSREIVIRRNRFENAGSRAVNIGGSTGLRYFRPPLKTDAGNSAQYYEAKDIRVEGNIFIGSGAPVAFVGCDGSLVRFNTIYRPRRWIVRILQETRQPDFVPARNGEFTDNLVAFRSDELRTAVNVGPHTAPSSFRFARNFWYCLDKPADSRPSLPVEETGGIYGKSPQFRDAENGKLGVSAESPARNVGAHALP